MAEPEHASICEEVRTACAGVARQSGAVRVVEARVGSYANGLGAIPPAPADPTTTLLADERDREDRAAFVLCLDAINFGSGWWPTIRKRAGRSGYATIASALTDRFRSQGRWRAQQLASISGPELAEVLGQDAAHPLVALYATALRDVGEHVRDGYGGSFAAVIDAADGSAPALAQLLSGWRAFADVSQYRGRAVPFYKRAQIAAADAHAAGLAALGELGRLTAFADNLVPHVLHVDGVLKLDPALERAIDEGSLLEHGSAAEVELRACAVHVVELLSAALAGTLTPAAIDGVLWHRGQEPRYKALPRPRCRTTAY